MVFGSIARSRGGGRDGSALPPQCATGAITGGAAPTRQPCIGRDTRVACTRAKSAAWGQPVASASRGSINAVYFDIEVEKGAFRADAKDPMASTTAAAVGFAAEFREAMGSAAWIERVVRGTSRLLGPAGASDTLPKCQASLASLRHRGICRQPGSFRPGNG